MQLPRVIWLYVSLAAVALQSFALPLVFMGFKLNREYIAAVLCINRDIPESGCDGQCYLMKKLKQAQSDDQGTENPTTKREAFWQYCTALLKKPILLPLRNTLLAPSHNGRYTSSCPSSIFHPPRRASYIPV
ncbi:MAG TPA: hypothetical protein VD772_08680 [Anseongella sp.]|nr:hypothetical protein [Anseongella sp.]